LSEKKYELAIVHPVTIGQWKKAIQEQAKTLFEGKRYPSSEMHFKKRVQETLHSIISDRLRITHNGSNPG
jgi:hypothetical protein